jgi:hypothetical protein
LSDQYYLCAGNRRIGASANHRTLYGSKHLRNHQEDRYESGGHSFSAEEALLLFTTVAVK